MPRRLSDLPSLPDETRNAILQYERGQELMSLTSTPGWDVLLTLLEEDIESDEQKLLSYRDSDPQVLFRMHAELQGKRRLLSSLKASVRYHTELVQNPPASIQSYTTL